MKRISLQIAGYESEPVEIHITPEATALTILTRLGLEECALSPSPDPGEAFLPSAPVFDQLREGERVYAILPGE